MTRYIGGDDIRALATHEVCVAAAQASLAAESAGRTLLPPRIDVPSDHGFIRAMPAVLDDVMGLKVMTLARGVGTRYLVLLYGTRDGALRGVFDADELTRLRTAAYTSVAAQLMVSEPPERLALIGSGFEAEGHLRTLARTWPLKLVTTYSRSAERRALFATRMSSELGIEVVGSDDMASAVGSADVLMLATKSDRPVLDGEKVREGAVVLSIGSTRPDLRELDRTTMARSGTILVDDPAQVRLESGDIIDGLEAGDVVESRLVAVSRAALDRTLLRREPGRDLLTFKSVGTALQDLSLARSVLEAAEAAGGGRDLGELSTLKPFADAMAGVSR